MTRTSISSWWLLAICAVLYALFAITIVFVVGSDGSPALRSLMHRRDSITQMGMLALAAGICTIAAGAWNFRKSNSWLLVLNGIACTAFGARVVLGASRAVTFRSIASLIVVMAVSIALYEFAAARTYRGHLAEQWLLGIAGVISVGFATVFLAFVLRWLKLYPHSAETFRWIGSYFGFSALCMLGLALRHFHSRFSSIGALPTA